MTDSSEMDSLVVPEFSPDMVLGYISQILMEEDMDDKFDVFHEDLALLAAEKPFYEILGETFPPLPDQNSGPSAESPDGSSISNFHVNSNGSSSDGILANDSWPYDPLEYRQPRK